MKKLQIKYEHFDPVQGVYKVVKQSDGCGPRFMDVNNAEPVLFKEIRERALNFYFDNDRCNNFMERITDCCISIHDVTGQFMDENENLWDYLKKKGVLISKTVFILRSCDNNFFNPESDNDDADLLPDPFGYDRSVIGAAVPKRRICSVCNCTYTGEDCIICQQNSEYELFNGEIPRAESPPPTVAEVRALRVNHFSYSKASNKVVIKVHRLKIKEDLIKEFRQDIVSFNLSFLIVCLIYLKGSNLFAEEIFAKFIFAIQYPQNVVFCKRNFCDSGRSPKFCGINFCDSRELAKFCGIYFCDREILTLLLFQNIPPVPHRSFRKGL